MMKRIIFTSLLASTLLHADLLQQKDYDTLADCIIATTKAEGILKTRGSSKYPAILKKNLPTLCTAAGLHEKITKETVGKFRNELNKHSYTLFSFFTSELTEDQYAPINNCLQGIKDNISEKTQLAAALVPFKKEQQEEIRATLKQLKKRVDGLLTDTKDATTEAVTSLLTETQVAVQQEATAFANEVKTVTQELKENFFESLVSSIAKFFGVTKLTTATPRDTNESSPRTKASGGYEQQGVK
jgi:hypothetical protein